jgi:hypothetical protein
VEDIMGELDIILAQLNRTGEAVDALSGQMSEVSGHCATLLERTIHLATREDVTSAIKTHASDCKASRMPAALEITAEEAKARTKVWLALAGVLTTAATIAAVYFGVSAQ